MMAMPAIGITIWATNRQAEPNSQLWAMPLSVVSTWYRQGLKQNEARFITAQAQDKFMLVSHNVAQYLVDYQVRLQIFATTTKQLTGMFDDSALH